MHIRHINFRQNPDSIRSDSHLPTSTAWLDQRNHYWQDGVLLARTFLGLLAPVTPIDLRTQPCRSFGKSVHTTLTVTRDVRESPKPLDQITGEETERNKHAYTGSSGAI